MSSRAGPLRAAFVIDTLRPGAGTENQLLYLLGGFDRDRIRPHVVCLHAAPGFDPAAVPCPVEVLGFHRMASGAGWRGLRRYRRLIREWDLDVVQTFFRDANLVGTLGAAGRVPVVSSRRNLGRGYWHTSGELALLRLLRPWTRLWMANSEAVADYTTQAEGVPRSRIRVVPNAVDAERFRPASAQERNEARAALDLLPEDFGVVSVANLRPVKGVDRLIEAFARVHGTTPRARLLLVGEGDEEPALRAQVAAADLQDAVRFLGARHDIPRILWAADALALASHGEGQSNAVIEAQASGVPVVATAVGGTPELLAEGRGLAVAAGDAGAFAEGLRTVAEKKDLVDAMTARALERIRTHHAPAGVLPVWERVLGEAAGREPSGGA